MGPTFVVQQFNGPQRPPEEIAILRVNGSDSVRLMYLDEKDVAAPLVSDGRLHIEMLPTKHTVIVSNASNNNERSPMVAFTAEAGKVYRVRFVPPESTARVFEVDRSSDAPRADVTIVEAPPPIVAPSPPATKPIEEVESDAGTL